MSGHSKWHNIKLKKGKVDGQRGALFTKLSKEIILAAKNGSSDPEANYRLKMAVDKARVNNMPQDNIKRAIARGSGADNEKQIEELRYEGYGPANVAVIIEVATDNRNRTASELRFLFSRNDGALGETGSVGWIFESRGLIEVDPLKLSEDALTEKALVDGVIDVRFGEPTEIVTEPALLMAAKDELEAAGLHVLAARLVMEAKTTTRPGAADTDRVLTFLDALEEHEDVQNVYSNVDFDDAALEAMLT
jgi:YebC/PmpR family DNA-binding regulatory protein